MSSKKPALPPSTDRRFADVVKECVERMMGRRGSKVTKLAALDADAVTSTPTAAQYNALRADMDKLRVKFNALLDQIGDYD